MVVMVVELSVKGLGMHQRGCTSPLLSMFSFSVSFVDELGSQKKRAEIRISAAATRVIHVFALKYTRYKLHHCICKEANNQQIRFLTRVAFGK